jgi:uncharacterized protein (DUF1501 family)
MTARTLRNLSRRDLLRQSGRAGLGAFARPGSLARLFIRPAATDPATDLLVVVFARGGYDGLNMIIPFGNEADYARRRPNIAIPAPDSAATRRATDLDGFFGMHPTLVEARWKEWFDAGIYAPVHAVHMDDPTRSHFDAMDFMERGTPGRKTEKSGWIGRHLAATSSLDASPFRAVGMGTMLQASLRGPEAAIVLQSIADFHLKGPTSKSEIDQFQQELQKLYNGTGWMDQQGQATFVAIDLLASAVGSGTYVPANGAVYPQTDFGRGMQQVAQLFKAGMGIEVACVDTGGWDTHANQTSADDPTTGGMATLMSNLAASITAFVTDLRASFDKADRTARGVTVVVMSEFGRRAYENGSIGTDHGHGNVIHVFGKGINGGKVHVNPWPGLADDQLDSRGDLAGTIEYRDVLGEILDKRLGNRALDRVFPNHAFNYLNLASALVVPTATPTPRYSATSAPTTVTPGPTPTGTLTPARTPRAFFPWANKAR